MYCECCNKLYIDSSSPNYKVNVMTILFFIEPLSPTNFRITETVEGVFNISVNFEWERPLGKGPEYSIESYAIHITSERGLHVIENIYESTISNLSLEYNVQYRAYIVSINCVGKSTPLFIENISFGELWYLHVI